MYEYLVAGLLIAATYLYFTTNTYKPFHLLAPRYEQVSACACACGCKSASDGLVSEEKSVKSPGCGADPSPREPSCAEDRARNCNVKY